MKTGSDLVSLAERHLGERYVLGAMAPKDDPEWDGPWDCAEFASWLVYQAARYLYGCADNGCAPAAADAYTGYWERDSRRLGRVIGVAEAVITPGAFLLRIAAKAACGHIVVSDGRGGTVEAHSSRTGVIRARVEGRRWDMGICPPGIKYDRAASQVVYERPTIYRLMPLGRALMQGKAVREIQYRLRDLGYMAAKADGIYGPRTHAAVVEFQQSMRLLVDGEVGPATLVKLEISL